MATNNAVDGPTGPVVGGTIGGMTAHNIRGQVRTYQAMHEFLSYK